ncbi:hypothetical protein TWF696_003968 [Orbilia brochopaga]|uniref:Uncharacterized protein n=1 Tax=Orbilia brochopaga TaxID=3140254 RepID=A0AAV9V4Q6_9PEZI
MASAARKKPGNITQSSSDEDATILAELAELAVLKTRYRNCSGIWRKKLINLLSLEPEILGPILHRIDSDVDLDSILADILVKDARFRTLWDLKDTDVTFHEILTNSMAMAMWTLIEQGEGHSASCSEWHRGLAVWVIAKAEREPSLPVALRGLPWFKTKVEPVPEIVLQGDGDD